MRVPGTRVLGGDLPLRVACAPFLVHFQWLIQQARATDLNRDFHLATFSRGVIVKTRMGKRENCNDPSNLGNKLGGSGFIPGGIPPVMMTDANHCPRYPNWIIPSTQEV